jgi:hypothetical protein
MDALSTNKSSAFNKRPATAEQQSSTNFKSTSSTQQQPKWETNPPTCQHRDMRHRSEETPCQRSVCNHLLLLLTLILPLSLFKLQITPRYGSGYAQEFEMGSGPPPPRAQPGSKPKHNPEQSAYM